MQDKVWKQMDKLLGVDRAQVRRAMIQYNTSYWQLPTRGFSVTIYNSRGNQINIAQIAILQMFSTNQIKSNQIKCWFLVRRENRSTRGKTSHSRVENQQTQSTFDAECGNRTRATLVEGKCSNHNANPATKTKTKTDMMLLVDANLTPSGVPQGQTFAQREIQCWQVCTMQCVSNKNRELLLAKLAVFPKATDLCSLWTDELQCRPVLTMGQCPVTNNEVQTGMIVRPGTIWPDMQSVCLDNKEKGD